MRSRCIRSKLSLHSQRNKPSEALYKVINWKANHSIRGKHHGTVRRWNYPDLRKLVGQVTLVTILWKVHDQWWLISWIGATFTLLSLIICAFCDFFFVCMFDKLNIGSFNSLKPDHLISPFPHENNLRVKKQFGNSVAIFKITRLLTF